MQMYKFEFNQDLIRHLALHRGDGLTTVFQVFSFMGEIEGYLLVITALFVAYDKRLALQSALVVLGAMIANHLAKIIIQNPRPFVVDGDYREHWAVSARNAAELAAEFSTPSGHAMAGAAFYGFLFLRIPSLPFRIGLVVAIIMVGASRPLIGVHYVEDIVLGWVLGAGIALLAHRSLDRTLRAWSELSAAWRLLVVTALSATVWVVTLQALGRPLSQLPTAFVAYLGLLTGLLLTIPIEERRLAFEPQGASARVITMRFAVMIALLFGALALLDWLFAFVAAENSAMGFCPRFLRYAIVGVAGGLATPWLFFRLGLALRPEKFQPV
mgnify:CR=1 FL=1